ncbi:MAG: hypothetical protein HZA90_08155 [Verrucomicrobia bacterium]|nr:hypothetical protein [Verrucomicrobiota bacterium]
MKPRLYKFLLVLCAVVLLSGAGQLQNHLNRERVRLGFTPLPNDPTMPPMLALTTQALGGFRGLIANALWIRANDLQLEDKFFELVQLSRWITMLEPRFVQVWVVASWNMSYNISVKFSEPADRWRWVRHGIELLRDDALRYNPDEALIYRELAWHFQHKMGMNLDDAHFYYKGAWAGEMGLVLARDARKFDGHPDFNELLNPQTDEAKARVQALREQYKLDPQKMKEVDDRYGPLDWRLPEAHAIYWAYLGLAKSKPADLITLRRVIYQSMQLSAQRGQLRIAPDGSPYLEPNLDIIPRASEAYEEMGRLEQDSGKRDGIWRAHKNFLKQAVFELYIHNRVTEADKWLKILREKYPDAVAPSTTLTDYAIERAVGEVKDGTQTRITSLVRAFVEQSYLRLVGGEEDEAAAYMQRAQELCDGYTRKTGGSERLRITPLAEIKKQVVDAMLDTTTGLPFEARARLRTALRLPAEGKP